MSNMMRWSPFRELEDIQSRLNRMLAGGGGERGEDAFLFADWTPAVDIQETNKEYAVKVDLPEVKKEDIKVELVDDGVTIQGTRKQEREEKGKKFHRVERQYGQFVRRFMIPGGVDPSKVQARFKDGVLKVTIPKSAAARPKSVDVKVS